MRRVVLGLSCVALVMGLAVPAGAEPRTRAEQVDAIFARYERGEQPGCAVGVGERGRAVLTRGYGVADLERGAPITRDSVFDIASASKQITAAVVYLPDGFRRADRRAGVRGATT